MGGRWGSKRRGRELGLACKLRKDGLNIKQKKKKELNIKSTLSWQREVMVKIGKDLHGREWRMN